MANPIQFKYGITTLFRIVKCVNVPVGDYYDLPVAPDNAVPVDGSDDLVKCPEVMFVTTGGFELQVPELPDPIPVAAGELSSAQRYRSALKIVATADNSSYTCITPRDNSFWDREVGFVASGEQINVTTPDANFSYVFIVSGAVTVGHSEYLVNALIPAPTDGDITLTATADTYFIHVWQ